MESLTQQLGKRVRLARIARDLSRGELARRAGVAKMTIDRLENAKSPPKAVYPETIVALARALWVSTDYLLGLTDQEHESELEPAAAR